MSTKIKNRDKDRVVILGAGPAGLAAGLTLSRQGVKPTIIERLSLVGGVSRTIVTQGFRFDLGAHRWFTKDQILDTFVHQLLTDEITKCPRSSHIYFNGKHVRYPLNITDILKNVGLLNCAAAVTSSVSTEVRNLFVPSPIVSMKDAYTAQFGPVLYRTFFQRYSEKLWGLSCDELSGDWVSQRSKGMSIWQTIKAALRKSDITSLIEEFEYPRLGIGRMSERMQEEIVKHGGEILLKHEVVGFVTKDNRIDAIRLKHEDTFLRVEVDHVLSSLPLPTMATWLGGSQNKDVEEATRQLHFRGLIFVAILIDKPQTTEDSWIYLQDFRLLSTRLHAPANFSKAMAPEGKSSLVFEIAASENDHMWQLTDAQLTKIVVSDLVNILEYVNADEIIGSKVVREPHAYPVYRVGYRKHLEKVNGFLSRCTNLTMIGRNGMYRYNNIDHSLESGIKAAENLLGAHHDLSIINTGKEYQEIKERTYEITKK
ncbi:FAD-dependent oxidoreductase [Thermodesulfobacteriota bacterium]